MLTWIALAQITVVVSLPLLLLPQLPSQGVLVALCSTGLGLLQFSQQTTRIVAVALLLFAWVLHDARQTVTDIERLAKPGVFTVQVEEVRHNAKQIKVRLLKENSRYLFPPRFAWISYGSETAEYCPGQHWIMHLRLRAVHARLNEGEFDAQRFALANHTPLQGRILKSNPVITRCDWRWQFIQRHDAHVATLSQRGTLKALAFGIRDDLSKTTRQLLRDTGTAHLMAISGMHIALAAGAGWLLARGIQVVFPARYIGYLFPLMVSWLIAAIYAWLSGGHAPAQRALLSLTLWMAIRIAGIQLNGWQIWSLCLGLLLIINPMNVLSDSFWLSALAVGSLLIWYHWFPLPARFRQQRRWLLLRLFHLQAGMMLLMSPLQVTMFSGISLTALIANLFAVPVISFITVPLILLAMLIPFMPVSAFIWWLANLSLQGLIKALTSLPTGWWPLQNALLIAAMVWGGLIVWRLQFLYRAPLSCSALALSLLMARQPQDEQIWRIDMLDVGHGLSMVISQGKRLFYTMPVRAGKMTMRARG